ncbi:MBL fold metallo-hydrolase [Bacillus sp. FJAT-45037]|uniref:MBL fold metallo-hydrolase n=1 Tax=Bacillus sp. FJAT-45037 TaxID=2011007 RepID=UPI000C24A007|nr:MBL fold metallo-hydrolase [Bacillus sp. FJAT-45037]
MTVKTERIHCITIPTPFLVGPVNCYLIEGEVLTLVDTGPKTEEGWNELKQQLNAIGYSTDEVKQILLTHHHPDHVGLTTRFKQARVVAHRFSEMWLSQNEIFFREYAAFFRHFYRQHGLDQDQLNVIERASMGYLKYVEPTTIDVCVKEGDSVPGLEDWKVVEVPGHAQSHLLFYRESDHVAIGGDVLLSSISSNALLEAPMEGDTRPKTLLQYRDSLNKLVDLSIKELHTGHGLKITNVEEVVKQRLLGQEERANAIYALLKEGQKTANQLSVEMFGRRHVKQPELTFSEVFGHLDLLMDQGKIDTVDVEGLIYFKIN